MPMTSSTAEDEKIVFVCRTCGSDDVFVDAWAVWSKVSQRWELFSTYDAAHCNNCDDECKLDSKPVL
jgi:hypothetical protein